MTRTHIPIALAALGLAAQPAAHAQYLTLNNSDVVTVSGAGTVGIINKQPVNNPTTSYNDSAGNGYAVQTNGASNFTLAAGGSITSTQAINGSADDALVVFGSGTVMVSGGTISAVRHIGLLSGGSDTVVVSGGTITAATGLNVYSGTVTVIGGTITANTGLFATQSGTINLFSQGDTPFMVTVNGTTTLMNNTSLPEGVSGTIIGTLFNGDTLNTTFANFGTGTINLNVGTPPAASPEPSPLAALGIGILGLSALALKARRRHIRAV